ncbi:MAG: hypothetical protein JZU59_16880, partial [Chromatium okenii]
MDAYKAAVDQGADGMECDVRLTKDNQMLLWHDADMKRTAGYAGRIAEMTYPQIKQQYPQAVLLEDLLELARDNDMELAIETKHPVPQGSLVEKKVLELLEQEELETDVVLMSFSWLALENIRKINPQQKTVALLHERWNYLMQRFSSAPILGPSVEYLRSNP